MNGIKFNVSMPKQLAINFQINLQQFLGDLYKVKLEISETVSMSGNSSESYCISIKKNEEEKIKEFVKELFDSGMTLDEIIETVSSVAITEDFKRGVSHEYR